MYLLSELEQIFPNIRGRLYRDDVLFITRVNSRLYDKMKKDLHKFVSRCGLKITLGEEKKSVNYLDINLNLATGIYNPFHKNNANIKYINISSNHCVSVNEVLVDNIFRRISNLSSNEEVFNMHASCYNLAIRRAKYDNDIKFIKKQHKGVFNLKTNHINTTLNLKSNESKMRDEKIELNNTQTDNSISNRK